MADTLRAGLGIALTTAALAFAAPALAFDRDCRSECYEKVRQPDTYATVERPVVVRPGYSEVVHTPPVVLDRVARVEAVPGRWYAHSTPAVYGSMARTVMVAPARTVSEHVPAVRQRVLSHVVVRPAKVGWQRSVDAFGRETMCKVEVPAQTRAVERDVVVAPARTVERVVPARYSTVAQPVLVQPARTHHVYQAPVYNYVSQPMVIRPATTEVIAHAPVVAVERERVLVGRGGYAWSRVGGHW